MVKYVLIVSQYYHSYVQKICAVQDDFLERARKMIEELEDYKRYPSEKGKRPYYYGDLAEKYHDSIDRALKEGGTCNLNDAGDIYFEFSDSVDYLVDLVAKYGRKSGESYNANKRTKRILKDVQEHHDKPVIVGIIKKYFVVI